MDRNQGGRPVFVELVTKSGESLPLALASKEYLDVQLEAGEFFYEISHIVSSVGCEECGFIKNEILTKGDCLIEEWDLEPWADCEAYSLKKGCPRCGSHRQADIIFTWYNYRVRFAGQKTKNCSIVSHLKTRPSTNNSV